jgi:hypothetical protein
VAKRCCFKVCNKQFQATFAAVILLLAPVRALAQTAGVANPGDQQKREYLESILYSPEAVRDWLAGRVVWGETYHPLLGWIHNERTTREGVDDSLVSYHYDPDGARKVVAYADRPCRINTYGDSFTSCAQVNDGETWQEYLAAHLQEPIRNFGIGGYSVYQSYRRMLMEEADTPTEYIIFNIFDDDHYRNLTGWRNIRMGITTAMRKDVSSPTLPYVKVNPAARQFLQFKNPCPTPELVGKLCDLDWVFDQFQDDFTLKLMMAKRNIAADFAENSYVEISALAVEHGLETKIDSPESLGEAVDALFNNAGFYATMRIIEKIQKFAAEHRKKVLYVLSYGNEQFRATEQTGKRFDQSLIDFLNSNQIPYVDLLELHQKDFAQRKLTIDEYCDLYWNLYWIGHYNPRGNFFTAWAIKDAMVSMLVPKPVSYRSTDDVGCERP